MELHKDCRKQNQIIKRYSSRLLVKWIPCTRVDEHEITQEGDWDDPIPYSGRYAVYEEYRDSITGKIREDLIYIAEKNDKRFRDIHENIDFPKLVKMDKTKKNLLNPYNYNQVKEIEESNKDFENKRKRRFREEDREKAKDMWKYVSGEPVITV